jgi:hypothetical protein
MFLVTVAIEPTTQAAFPVLEPGHLIRALSAEAALDNGLEHVSACVGPDCLQIGLFYRSLSREIAETTARRICMNLLESQPLFTGWRLVGDNS